MWHKLVQMTRMFVGIGDYEVYLAHMHSHHPELKPKTRAEYYQYCLEARYPAAGKAGSRCPC